MQSFWQKIKAGYYKFMQGRYGADKLTQIQLWTGLALYILSIFLRWPILVYASMGIYIWAVFRVMSRNRVARAKENQTFLDFVNRSFSRRFPRQARHRPARHHLPQMRAWL